jgi:signal transduction histidine kinase
VLVAAGVAVVTVAGSYAMGRHAWHQPAPPLTRLGPAGYLLAVAACAALAWRRMYPTAVLLVVFGLVLGYNQAGYPPGAIYLPLIVAFCTAIFSGDRRVGYCVLAIGYLISTCAGPLLHRNALPSAAQFGGLAAWLLVFAAVAELARIRARARRAETEEALAAEQARAEQARRQAGDERLRIAQDLHDILAHQLALITVQANVGLAMIEHEPSRAAGSLTAIKDAGNRALSELRTVLEALRTTGAVGGTPLPDGTGRLPGLVRPDGTRSADGTGSAHDGAAEESRKANCNGPAGVTGPAAPARHEAGALGGRNGALAAGRDRRGDTGAASAGHRGQPGQASVAAAAHSGSAGSPSPWQPSVAAAQAAAGVGDSRSAGPDRKGPAAQIDGVRPLPAQPYWPGALRPAPLVSRASDLAAVIGGTRAAGLTVRQQTAGAQRQLPAPLDQAAYRIVQESLTNAVRHGGPGTNVRLRIEYGPADMCILVEDDGAGTPGAGADAGSGNGLAGMRERAAALHGTLQAGPRPAGGFQVSARLPLGPAR